jgi:hypothetical protein
MQRGTKWYLRVKVPDDVFNIIGKREIWRSLDTGDHHEAKRRYFDKRAEAERTFAIAREGVAGQQQMVADWLRRFDQRLAEADFGTHGPDLRDAAEQAEVELGIFVEGEDGEVMPAASFDATSCGRTARQASHEEPGFQ